MTAQEKQEANRLFNAIIAARQPKTQPKAKRLTQREWELMRPIISNDLFWKMKQDGLISPEW